MESIFMDNAAQPTDDDLLEKLGSSHKLWSDLRSYLLTQLKDPSEEWNYPGKKYGWSFRMKSKKRNIIYFLPRDGYFKVAFVFGDKAVDKIAESSVQEFIKTELAEAKKYAEGQGIRIDVKNDDIMDNIKTLIKIKLEN
jgi:hypothetical protein